MSNQSVPLSDLASSPYAKFESIGTSYAGRIVAIEKRQQTDLQQRPLYFDVERTQPRYQYVITIEQANGENVALYAKGGNFKAAEGSGTSMLGAINEAARAAGATALTVGDELAVAHTGLSAPSDGKFAAKLFTAQYRVAPPVAASVPIDDLFSS